MKIARRFFINGLVQGVGFRFFTQRAAARHQVLGFVKNLEDGRVEAFAQGNERSVKAFHEELLAGPTYSRVEEIERDCRGAEWFVFYIYNREVISISCHGLPFTTFDGTLKTID